MAEENLPSEEEIERGKQAIDVLTQLSDVLLQNLNINRENVDAIKDSVDAAKDLAAPFNLTNEAAKEINKTNRDLAQLNAKLVNQEENIANRKRASKDVSKDIVKSEEIRNRLITEAKQVQDKLTLAVEAGDVAAVRALGNTARGLAAQLDQTRDIDLALKNELASVKKIENAFGLSGKALEGVNKLLGGALPDLDRIREGAAD